MTLRERKRFKARVRGFIQKGCKVRVALKKACGSTPRPVKPVPEKSPRKAVSYRGSVRERINTARSRKKPRRRATLAKALTR